MQKFSSWLILWGGIGILAAGLSSRCGDKGNGPDDDNGDTADPWEVIPADQQVTGWVGDTTAAYKITAPESLHNFINGGDFFYLERGFVSGVRLMYYNQDTVLVTVYKCVNADSAQVMFRDDVFGQAEPVAGVGDSAHFIEFLNEADLNAVKDCYYISISFLSLGAAGRQLGTDFANAIITNIIRASLAGTGFNLKEMTAWWRYCRAGSGPRPPVTSG